MPTQTDKPDNPPPTATNVATAYPSASRSPAPRLLALALLLSTLAVAVFHYRHHPRLHPLIQPINSLLDGGQDPPSTDASTPTTPPPPTSVLPPASLAVCYTGNLGTHATVVPQNLDVIRKLDANPAVFYYIDLNDDYLHEETSQRFQHPHSIGALQAALNLFNATVETFVKAEVPAPSGACYERELVGHQHYSHNYIRFFAANECYRLVKRHETERDAPFEWILHLRPDMQILVNIPPAALPSRVHLSGAAMALVPRAMADSYFGAVRAFEGDRCKQFDQLGDGPCSNYAYESESTECLLIKWLKEQGITPSNGVYVNRRIVYPATD